MKERFYLILKDIDSLKEFLRGPFSLINRKGKLIMNKYSKIISEIISMIESEKDLTKNTNLLIYFRNDALVGMKLISILSKGCVKHEAGYEGYDIDYAISCIDNECNRLKSKIDNYKNGNIVFETPEETIERLKPLYSEEEIKTEVSFTKKLSMKFTDYRDKKYTDINIDRVDIE